MRHAEEMIQSRLKSCFKKMGQLPYGFEIARFLLDAGAMKDPPRVDNGATPLHLAAESGHLNVVKLLVEVGANKNQPALDGSTALNLAAERACHVTHVDVVGFLLLGQTRSSLLNRSKQGAIPLHLAVFHHFGHRDMGLSENSVPLNPMVLLIIIPMKNGYFIGNIYPTFSGPNPHLESLRVLVARKKHRPCERMALQPRSTQLADGRH